MRHRSNADKGRNRVGRARAAVNKAAINDNATPRAQAIVTAAQQIATGEIDAAVAGGTENMDRATYLLD